MKKLLLTTLLALPLVANAYSYVLITPESIKDDHKKVMMDLDRFTPKYVWTGQVVSGGLGIIETKLFYNCSKRTLAKPYQVLKAFDGRVLKTESYPVPIKVKKGSIEEFQLNKICEYKELYSS